MPHISLPKAYHCKKFNTIQHHTTPECLNPSSNTIDRTTYHTAISSERSHTLWLDRMHEIELLGWRCDPAKQGCIWGGSKISRAGGVKFQTQSSPVPRFRQAVKPKTKIRFHSSLHLRWISCTAGPSQVPKSVDVQLRETPDARV